MWDCERGLLFKRVIDDKSFTLGKGATKKIKANFFIYVLPLSFKDFQGAVLDSPGLHA